MKRKWLALILTGLMLLTTITPTVFAKKVTVATIISGGWQYAPINLIIKQMGGTIQKNVDRTTTYTINKKAVTIDENYAYAIINSEMIPYETKTVGNFTQPVHRTPVYKNGNMYVPVSFLTSKVGLKLEVKKGQVSFDEVAAKPVSKPKVLLPKPSGKKTTKTTYTGSEVKQKLYSLGFTDYNSGVRLNPYGKTGDIIFTSMDFMTGSGDCDMTLSLYQDNADIDKKLKTILNWILPTKGNILYSILDTPDLISQSGELDNRIVTIKVDKYGLILKFGPIKK